MAKEKKKKSKEIQDLSFKEQIKLLLGGSSSRVNKYLYFNFKGLNNVIVASNGDYELIHSCSPVTMSIQILKFKDIELFTKIKEFFKVPDNTPYVIRTALLLKALVKEAIESLEVKQDSNKTSKLTLVNNEEAVFSESNSEQDDDSEDTEQTFNSIDLSETNDEDEEPSVEEELEEILLDSFPTNDIFGAVINDVYCWSILENEVLTLYNEYTDEYFNSVKHIEQVIDIESVDWYSGNQFRPIKITNNIFNDTSIDREDCYVICIDGQDTISIKTFLKKVNGTCKLYIWSKNTKSIKCMTTYEDNSVIIKSIRPFYEIIPLIKKN